MNVHMADGLVDNLAVALSQKKGILALETKLNQGNASIFHLWMRRASPLWDFDLMCTWYGFLFVVMVANLPIMDPLCPSLAQPDWPNQKFVT